AFLFNSDPCCRVVSSRRRQDSDFGTPCHLSYCLPDGCGCILQLPHLVLDDTPLSGEQTSGIYVPGPAVRCHSERDIAEGKSHVSTLGWFRVSVGRDLSCKSTGIPRL